MNTRTLPHPKYGPDHHDVKEKTAGKAEGTELFYFL